MAAVGVLLVSGGCSQAPPMPAFAAMPVGDGRGAAAELFAPATISDGREQWRITFTPDGRTAYFAAGDGFFPVTRQATIYLSHRRGPEWSPPEVAPFSGVYSDMDPFVSPDGQRLYFSSIRPVGGVMPVDLDLWMVERGPHGWSEPVHLGPEVNSPADELYASASADGTLYFASGPLFPEPGRHWDIYSAARDRDGFRPREALGPGVNRAPAGLAGEGLQDAWEFNPEISADGRTLLFTSLRPGGYGWGDLYVSHRVDGEWTPARNLGPPVNTAADEYHPTLSRDGRDLYFLRRAGEAGDFYVIGTEHLGLR